MYQIRTTPVRELPATFTGKGEVRGFTFQKINNINNTYIYKVSHPEILKCHYEVFYRKIYKRFEMVSYPRSPAFGVWAWTYPSLEQAIKKAAEIGGENIAELMLSIEDF